MGRCSGLDFRGIHIERGVGFEHLRPTVLHPMGLDSSDLDPRIIKVLPRLPDGGFFCDVQVFS